MSNRMLALDTINIQGLDFCVENVPGDGNCFYHCLSVCTAGDYSRTLQYRHQICQNIFRNWDNWQRRVSVAHGPDMTIYNYWGKMLKLNAWATNCEIEVPAMILNCKINVWLKGTNSSYTLASFGPQNSQNINLLLDNNHFQILHEVPHQSHYQTNGQTQLLSKN